MLDEIPRIVRILDIDASQLPEFTTVYARIQELRVTIWCGFLRLSAELHDTDDILAMDATGVERIAASQHSAKRTKFTF